MRRFATLAGCHLCRAYFHIYFILLSFPVKMQEYIDAGLKALVVAWGIALKKPNKPQILGNGIKMSLSKRRTKSNDLTAHHRMSSVAFIGCHLWKASGKHSIRGHAQWEERNMINTYLSQRSLLQREILSHKPFNHSLEKQNNICFSRRLILPLCKRRKDLKCL